MTRVAGVVAIDDPADDRLGVFFGLRDHVARQRRERPGGDMAPWFIAEGWVVIERARASGMALESVLVDATRVAELPAFPDEVTVYAAGSRVLHEVAGRPWLRDAIGCFVRPGPQAAAALLVGSKTVAVLERVVNPTNMGVIMRCAAGLGVDAVLVDPESCDPFYRRAVRVSMGECFAVPHARLEPFPLGLDVVREHGFAIAALTPAAEAVDIDDLSRQRPERLAIVLGSEGPGLSAAALEAADQRVRIPMSAGVDSINVGTAAAVAFHALRAG